MLEESGTNKGMKWFNKAIQDCKSEKEALACACMLTTMATKLIHGIEGRKFKKDFLRGAISDNEPITMHRVQ